MPPEEKKTSDNEVITHLHIPDEMIVDPYKLSRHKSRRKKKAANALQIMILVSVTAMIVGALYIMRSQPVFYQMAYTLWGGNRVSSHFSPALLQVAFFIYLGNLLLCAAGLPVYFRLKKKSGPGAVYFAAGAAISIVIMVFLFVNW